MSISIIIPAYNSSLLIARTLNSVLGQAGNIIKEIIVIDDGSTDGTVEIINDLNIPNLILFRQTNKGPASARNKGIEYATGKYIAFLDADDYWEPNFLSETYSFLKAHNEAIAVSTAQIHKFPGRKDLIIPSLVRNHSTVINHPIILDNFYEFWAKYNHVCTGSVLMRTEVVKKARGQRVDLRITEDLEFWALLATFGKWGFIPKILFVSDGGIITQQLGWRNKNRLRWNSATSVDNWEKRIIKNIPGHLISSYTRARGRIAQRITYSMILSERGKIAKEMVIKYGGDFPNNKLSKMLNYASRFPISWIIICNLVVLKERYRNIKIHAK